jgi:hypothetical protein
LKIKIDREYSRLVPELSTAEYEELKQSIKDNGLWHPITVNKESIVLDGHHRFKACHELDIHPTIEFKNFATPLLEKQFVINSNLKRRQLNDFQKAELGFTLEGIYSESARQRQLSSLKIGDKTKVPSVSNDNNGEKEKGRTSFIVSNQIGLSATIYNRAKKIILEGSEPVKQQLRTGRFRISREYNKIIKLERIKAAEQLTLKNPNPILKGKNYLLKLGDMRVLGKEIPDNSIHMIFTDPPYDKEHLYLYDELAILSLRVLIPGGSLAVIVPNGGPEFEYVFDRIRQ